MICTPLALLLPKSASSGQMDADSSCPAEVASRGGIPVKAITRSVFLGVVRNDVAAAVAAPPPIVF